MNQSSALYGKSFYDLAKEEKITKEVLEEMELVKALFRENPDYIRLLLEPSIPKKERLSLLICRKRYRLRSFHRLPP